MTWVICFTEVRFTNNLSPVEESTKNESFSTLSLPPTVTKTKSVPSSLSTKDQSLSKADHKDKELLLALQ
jgi:hypothetical protein